MADSTSEADISEEQSNTSKSTEQQKKDRIRDNQRRSRARRQEHLADLERRLAACRNACREAEIQRTAFRDAQIENSRLRSLLKVTGVDENLTQSYINQGTRQAQNTDSNHRNIRPRVPAPQDGTKSEVVRDMSSTQAAPFPIESATFEPGPVHASYDLSLNTLPSNYSSPAPQPLPMAPHMLHGAHLQYHSIFEPTSQDFDNSPRSNAFQSDSQAEHF